MNNMNVAQKEELIIKLNDERLYLKKLLKEYIRNIEIFKDRIEEINHEIEELLK